jgi:phospholipid/cholesterol/gamma-HCH transport system substrate-binding protein
MQMRTVEISVGAFVLAGVLALVFLAVRVSGINLSQSSESYTLEARFDEVAGLKARARVAMSGVTIGRVISVAADKERGQAVVLLEIDGAPGDLTTDTGAAIVTEGILGARYISLLPGADEDTLGDGDEILDTQGAFVLESLIGDLVTRLGAS